MEVQYSGKIWSIKFQETCLLNSVAPKGIFEVRLKTNFKHFLWGQDGPHLSYVTIEWRLTLISLFTTNQDLRLGSKQIGSMSSAILGKL